MSVEKILLTKEDMNKLKSQIQELKEKIIPQINAELQEAIEDGDLRENAPFDIAKQRLVEARDKLNKLEEMLKNAKLVKATTDQTVGLQSHVTILLDKNKVKFQVVSELEADPANNKFSTNSPLAKAVMGKKVGDTTYLSTPTGDKKEIKILEVG